jgi:hypothetical protein
MLIDYPTHIEQSLQHALAKTSKLTETALSVQGFSTPTMRHLFNNLCSGVRKYLEVGVWLGGTATASVFNNNNVEATFIDNFSQDFSHKGVLETLQSNLEMVRPESGPFTLFNEDCWKFDVSKLSGIDLFFFDGRHDFEDQRKALPYFLECMSNEFIFIVDDSTWVPVREGTKAGLDDLKGKITIKKQWLLHPPHGDHPVWHNGVDIYLCEKL